jgi:hypothetical protein
MPLKSEIDRLEQQYDMKKKEMLVKISACCQRVFNNPDGNAVLVFLRGQKAGFTKDPYQHAFNAGKSFIVETIEDMLDDKIYEQRLEHIDAQNKTT